MVVIIDKVIRKVRNINGINLGISIPDKFQEQKWIKPSAIIDINYDISDYLKPIIIINEHNNLDESINTRKFIKYNIKSCGIIISAFLLHLLELEQDDKVEICVVHNQIDNYNYITINKYIGAKQK